jgi:hypothetical protein
MGPLGERLYGFFDESGTHDGARVLALGGWVGTEEDWEDFQTHWDAALAKHGVSAFHFSKCENGRGEFEGWSSSKKARLTEDLIRVICRHNIQGFCGAIPMGYYKGIVQGSGSILEEKHSPYVLLESYLIEIICKKVHSPVHYVFEEQREFRKFAISNSWDIREKFPGRDKKMAAIVYRPKAKYAGLQAADLLVYESAKSLGNRLYEPSRPARQSMLALVRCKGKDMEGGWFDEAADKKWLEWNGPDPKK